MATIRLVKSRKKLYGVLSVNDKEIERYRVNKSTKLEELEARYKHQGSINPDIYRHRFVRMIEIRDYTKKPTYIKGSPHFYFAKIKIGKKWIQASSTDVVDAPDGVKRDEARRNLAKRVSAYLFQESDERMGQAAIAEVIAKGDEIDPNSYREGWVYYEDVGKESIYAPEPKNYG